MHNIFGDFGILPNWGLCSSGWALGKIEEKQNEK